MKTSSSKAGGNYVTPMRIEKTLRKQAQATDKKDRSHVTVEQQIAAMRKITAQAEMERQAGHSAARGRKRDEVPEHEDSSASDEDTGDTSDEKGEGEPDYQKEGGALSEHRPRSRRKTSGNARPRMDSQPAHEDEPMEPIRSYSI